MVPGAQEDSGDGCNAQSLEERLVVRHDDRSLSLAEFEKYVGSPPIENRRGSDAAAVEPDGAALSPGAVVGAWDDGNPDGLSHGFIATPLPSKTK